MRESSNVNYFVSQALSQTNDVSIVPPRNRPVMRTGERKKNELERSKIRTPSATGFRKQCRDLNDP